MRAVFWKSVALLVLAAAAGGVGWLFVGADATKAPRHGPRGPVPVVVTRAALGPLIERIEAIGTARANESLTLTAKVTEFIETIHFREGQRVEKGALLVQLRDREQRAQLAKARADLVAAERQHERIAKLARRGAATTAALEQATARMQALKAEIAAIGARIADRAIRAPFAGVVGLRQVSPGTLIQPGTAIATLDDLSTIKVDFSVPETYLAALARGQEIEARAAAYPKRRFTGRIMVISPRVNPATRTVTVRARLPNRERSLKPGMLMVIDVIRARRRALLVPEEAIVPIRDKTFVYVVGASGRVRRVAVRLGMRRPGMVEIRRGLKPGDRVVVEGTSRLRPGARVRVTRTVPPEGGS